MCNVSGSPKFYLLLAYVGRRLIFSVCKDKGKAREAALPKY